MTVPGSATTQFSSMLHVFWDTATRLAERTAVRSKKGGSYQPMTWKELGTAAREVSLGLVALGIAPGEHVSILGGTHVGWVEADLGILGAGAITVPIYQSNPAADCAYVIQNAGARAVFVDEDKQLAKINAHRKEMPTLAHVIHMNAPSSEGVIGWDELRAKGRAYDLANPKVYAERMATLTPQTPLTIIYTSGTTGAPKGAILSHGNMMFEANSLNEMNIISSEDDQLLFLPMAHVFAKVLECCWWRQGHVMSFAENVDKLVANMSEVHPTIMGAVPRVYEKIYARVVSSGTEGGGLKAKLFAWALSVEGEVALLEAKDKVATGLLALQWALAQKLVFTKIKAKLDALFGGRMRIFVSGGAPLSIKIAYFFKHAGLLVLEGYGMTETAAGSTITRPHLNKPGTVGLPLPGSELRIAEDGEVLVRGPHIMLGYHGLPEATAETIDSDGWLHTGDIGTIDADGCLRITDRKKDLIITAGGKNVAPQNLENQLKTIPLVSQAVVLGDRRKYLCALFTLNYEAALRLAEAQNIEPRTPDALFKNAAIRNELQAALDRFNASVAQFESIKKFAILPGDFTQESGELTPSLKVKRKLVAERYSGIVDGLYDERLE